MLSQSTHYSRGVGPLMDRNLVVRSREDETVKGAKRLIFPGSHSRLPRSRESARKREREREREREKDTGSKALMEQRCFNQHGCGHMYCLTRWLFSAMIKIKFPDLQSVRPSLSKRELQTITFYRMAHKKEEGTYHRNEKCLDSSALGKACEGPEGS